MTIEQRPSLSIALPKSYLFTSESVTEGHPDKMCDQISDAILDAIISKEIELEREGYIAPSGQPADVSRMRCACETLATTGLVAVAGEIRTQAYVDVPAIVREVVCGIGYDRAKYGFDGTTCGVVNAIHEQSPDIAQGVDESWEAAHGGAADDPYERIGAGDQGMMFGYACDETSTLMPMPIYLAQRMSERLAAVRKDGTLDYLRPDGKTQVSVRYEDGAPKWVEKVVVSTQHAEEAPYERLRADVVEQVVRPVLAGEGVALSPDAEIHVNPTGRFVIGGRLRPHGPQGHRGHLRRHGTARRRGLLRQGLHEGGPLGGLRGALGGEERGCRGPGRALRGAGGLRHRRGAPRVAHGGDVRHREGGGGGHRARGGRGVRPAPRRHHRRAGFAPPHLPQDGRLRPLRPRAARVHLGAHRPRRGSAKDLQASIRG